MKVVVPKIKDQDFKSAQELKLKSLESKYEENRANHDALKKLLMESKSNVFNMQLRYPTLKYEYDQAAGKLEEDLDEQTREIFNENLNYEARKKKAKLRLKRFQDLAVFERDEESEDLHLNDEKKKAFIGNI